MGATGGSPGQHYTRCTHGTAHSGGQASGVDPPAQPPPAAPPLPLHCSARTKRIVGIKNLDIYALALYVDQGAARSALQGRFRGSSAASLAADQELFDGEPGL